MKPYLYYAKTRWIEFLLCGFTSFALCTAIFNGFYINEQLQNNYLLLAGGILVLTALCYIGGYNKKSILAASAAGLIILMAVLIVLQKNYDLSDGFKDTESNPYLYAIIIIVTALAVYFTTRTGTGTGILFAAGGFLIAALQFLYETVDIYSLILFLFSCGITYIFKRYQKNVLNSETVKPAFGSAFAVSVLICAVILLCAAAIFFGVIKPLNPPAKELKLITDYKALEVMDKVGVADMQNLFDSDELTDNTSEKDKESNQAGDKKDSSKGDNQAKENENKKQKNQPTELDKNKSPLLYAIKYKYGFKALLLLIPLLILLLAAAVLAKLYQRKRWLKKTMEKDIRQQITAMYAYYVKRFGKMGVPAKPWETPAEFAAASKNSLQCFKTENIDFPLLTDIFIKAKYSTEKIDKGEYRCYLDFHKMFYPCCRKHLGKFKYILKFFIL